MERAIEAVLGERLQWVVVERFEHARAAVAYLREHALGSATFLPLEHLPAAGGAGADDNGVRWVSRSVGASAPSLVHHLLGQVAVVEHLDEAEALWRRNGVVATYVTPDGEVLGPTGRLHGGGKGTASGRRALAAGAQASAPRPRVWRCSGSRPTWTRGRPRSRRSRRRSRCDASRSWSSRKSVQARLADRLAGEKDLERAAQEHERMQRHLETISSESRQVAREAEETGATLARLTQRIAVARDAEGAIDVAAARVRDAIEGAQADETALGAELTGVPRRSRVGDRAGRRARPGAVTARRDRARPVGARRAGGAAPDAARRAADVARRRARAHRRRGARGRGRARSHRHGGPAGDRGARGSGLRASRGRARVTRRRERARATRRLRPRDRHSLDRVPGAARGAGAGGVARVRRRRADAARVSRSRARDLGAARARVAELDERLERDRPGQPGRRRRVPRARRAADVPSRRSTTISRRRSRISRRRSAV